MNKFVKFVFVFVIIFMCSACKEHKEIRVHVSDGEVVFLLPQLPILGTLHVEQLNTQTNTFQQVWTISFESSLEDPRTVERIVYGKAPKEAKVEVMSVSRPLMAGVLYSVGMDIGPIVASGFFVVEKSGSEIKVKNLTYQEANDFRKANAQNNL